ncbi:hypothetical protein Tco_1473692 [Tanacetum coccineum]
MYIIPLSFTTPNRDPHRCYLTSTCTTSRRADIPEADMPPRKRLLLTTPRPSCEVGESSAAAAARQPGPTMAHRVDYSLVDTMETRFRDTERRMMTALEMVNMRVSYQVDVRSRESSEFYSRHHDAQKDRATMRAEIEVLRRERLAYEQESMENHQALARSEAYCRALEVRVTVLETEVRRHEWQRQAADDFAVRHIMRTQALEAGARVDTLEDTGLRPRLGCLRELGTGLDASDLLMKRRREEMRELRAADRTRQQQLIQTLTAMQTLQRETIPLQGLVTTLQGQVTALQGQVMTLQGQVTALQGQQGPAGGPAQPELPEEAGSSS